MSDRQNISSGSPYEPVFGYSRAVKVRDMVFVSGTVAWGDDGKVAGLGDMYAQTKQALLNIEKALNQAGATLANVVRTRIFVTASRARKRWRRPTAKSSRRFGPARRWLR